MCTHYHSVCDESESNLLGDASIDSSISQCIQHHVHLKWYIHVHCTMYMYVHTYTQHNMIQQELQLLYIQRIHTVNDYMYILIVCRPKCALFTYIHTHTQHNYDPAGITYTYGLQFQYYSQHHIRQIEALDQDSHAAHFKEKLSCKSQTHNLQLTWHVLYPLSSYNVCCRYTTSDIISP